MPKILSLAQPTCVPYRVAYPTKGCSYYAVLYVPVPCPMPCHVPSRHWPSLLLIYQLFPFSSFLQYRQPRTKSNKALAKINPRTNEPLDPAHCRIAIQAPKSLHPCLQPNLTSRTQPQLYQPKIKGDRFSIKINQEYSEKWNSARQTWGSFVKSLKFKILLILHFLKFICLFFVIKSDFQTFTSKLKK